MARRKSETPAQIAAKLIERKDLEAFKLHEVLHTAHVLESTFATHILERDDVQADPGLCEAAEAAHRALIDFYQLVGRTPVRSAT